MALLLHAEANFTALIATECSTFVHVNTGTSKRSDAMPDGDVAVPSVQKGNGLAACSCLFALVVTLLEGTFLLEQPGSSVLMKTERMQWLVGVLEGLHASIYRQLFWMSGWGHKYPKRTALWSNSPGIRVFTTTKLALSHLKMQEPTMRKYVSKSGKDGYTANQKVLKDTEQLWRIYIGLTFDITMV